MRSVLGGARSSWRSKARSWALAPFAVGSIAPMATRYAAPSESANETCGRMCRSGQCQPVGTSADPGSTADPEGGSTLIFISGDARAGFLRSEWLTGQSADPVLRQRTRFIAYAVAD